MEEKCLPLKIYSLASLEDGSEVTEMNGLTGERLEVTIRTIISTSEMCDWRHCEWRTEDNDSHSCTCTHSGPQISSLKQDSGSTFKSWRKTTSSTVGPHQATIFIVIFNIQHSTMIFLRSEKLMMKLISYLFDVVVIFTIIHSQYVQQ